MIICFLVEDISMDKSIYGAYDIALPTELFVSSMCVDCSMSLLLLLELYSLMVYAHKNFFLIVNVEKM